MIWNLFATALVCEGAGGEAHCFLTFRHIAKWSLVRLQPFQTGSTTTKAKTTSISDTRESRFFLILQIPQKKYVGTKLRKKLALRDGFELSTY